MPITRPQRRRIMRITAARVSRKVAVRLTAITLSQSSSLNCTNRLSRLTPALATRMSSLLHFLFRARHQGLDRVLVGEIAGQHVHAILRVRRRARRARRGACRRSRRWRPGACSARAIAPPMAPVAPVTSAVLPVRSNIMNSSRPSTPTLRMTSRARRLEGGDVLGLPIALALAPSAMRLIRPLSTLPAPTS